MNLIKNFLENLVIGSAVCGVATTLLLVFVGLLLLAFSVTSQEINAGNFWSVVFLVALIGGLLNAVARALGLEMETKPTRKSGSRLRKVMARVIAPVAASTPGYIMRILNGLPYVHTPVTTAERYMIVFGTGFGALLGFAVHILILRLGGYSKNEIDKIHRLKRDDEEH